MNGYYFIIQRSLTPWHVSSLSAGNIGVTCCIQDPPYISSTTPLNLYTMAKCQVFLKNIKSTIKDKKQRNQHLLQSSTQLEMKDEDFHLIKDPQYRGSHHWQYITNNIRKEQLRTSNRRTNFEHRPLKKVSYWEQRTRNNLNSTQRWQESAGMIDQNTGGTLMTRAS